jgi:GNAT superfamily N-acetyltransferase
MTYKMKTAESVVKSPCLPLLVQGWSELLNNKDVDINGVDDVICGKHNILWFEYNDIPVSVLTFTCHPELDYVWIRLVYTLPEHRGVGLYSKLYTSLKNIIKKKGIKKISGGISCTNTKMKSLAEKLGRKPEYIVYSEILS